MYTPGSDDIGRPLNFDDIRARALTKRVPDMAISEIEKIAINRNIYKLLL